MSKASYSLSFSPVMSLPSGLGVEREGGRGEGGEEGRKGRLSVGSDSFKEEGGSV